MTLQVSEALLSPCLKCYVGAELLSYNHRFCKKMINFRNVFPCPVVLSEQKTVAGLFECGVGRCGEAAELRQSFLPLTRSFILSIPM